MNYYQVVIAAILLFMAAAIVVLSVKWMAAKREKRKLNKALMGVSTVATAKIFQLADRLDRLAPVCRPEVAAEVEDISSNLKDLLCTTQEGLRTSVENRSGPQLAYQPGS